MCWLPYDSILIHIGAPTEVSRSFEGPASRDSMLSAFRMGPAASGRGLCDIDRTYIQSYEITCQKIGNSLHAENISISWLFRFEL